MKRIFTGALTLFMLLSLAATAYADILWSPMDNQFFDSHHQECEYLGRSYYANGSAGFVTAWEAPGGTYVREQYRNGEVLWVGYTYRSWGLVSRWEDGEEISGWVPMADLYLVYDHISFEEEYGAQFQDYSGEFADYEGEAGEEFCFWEYPYAGEPDTRIAITQDMLDALRGSGEQSSYISKVYVDENGRNWGFVNYLYGIRNFWILLDDPTCENVTASRVPKADELIRSGELVPPQEPSMPAQSLTPYLLVAGVVAATAVLLAVFYGKRKKSPEN